MRLYDPYGSSFSHFTDVQEFANAEEIIEEGALASVCVPDDDEIKVSLEVLIKFVPYLFNTGLSFLFL